VLRSVPQTIVMATIVATALCVPAVALIALAAFALFRVPLESLLTFGGWLGLFDGVVAWWAILLVPSLVYAAYMMPWGGRDG
jgi:hypothetical protein